VVSPLLLSFYARAGNRVRTDDLLITNQLLYQLSYAGFSGAADHTSEPIAWQTDFEHMEGVARHRFGTRNFEPRTSNQTRRSPNP
jgi:hypothetical protein